MKKKLRNDEYFIALKPYIVRGVELWGVLIKA